jgi:predicted O-methyltransferase YrrM
VTTVLTPLKHALAGAVPVAAAGTLAAKGGTTAAVVTASTALGGLAGLCIWFARDNRRRLAGLQRSMATLRTEVQAGVRADSHTEGLASLERRLEALAESHTALPKLLDKSARQSSDRLLKELTRGGNARVAEVEALLNLYGLFDVRAPFPPVLSFAAGGDTRLEYVREILNRQPELVVECGSGLSTVWAAYALERLGGNGRVVALEHEEKYATATRVALAEHGLSGRAEVRTAPLTAVPSSDGGTQQWYDPAACADLTGIGLVFVDGPPQSVGPRSRYPALPMLRERLAPGATVMFDDAHREAEVIALWQERWPEMETTMVEHARGTAVLRVPRD